jgi:putative toxin-antitoxin system antitoxin component (TIGR02293 family)
MGTPQALTPPEQLAAQLEHPSAQAIWDRALEVFGDETRARHWMATPRGVLGGRSPQQLAATGEPAEQRHALEVLIRIEYGIFS